MPTCSLSGYPEVPQLAGVSGEAARQSVWVLGRMENVNLLLSPRARALVRLPQLTEHRRGAGGVGSRHPGASKTICGDGRWGDLKGLGEGDGVGAGVEAGVHSLHGWEWGRAVPPRLPRTGLAGRTPVL